MKPPTPFLAPLPATAPRVRSSGFTLVELLLALALGVLVAAILAALTHGLLTAGAGQAERFQGPLAARAAIRTLARDLTCAFHPPVKDLAPLTLATSTEIDQPQVALSFYAPGPAAPPLPNGYDIENVTYQVMLTDDGRRELLRIAAPCSGPRTNAPVTNVLLTGRFDLSIVAITNGTACAAWPPPNAETLFLPPSLRLSLDLPDADPIQTEVLIQTATGIPSPRERPNPSAPPVGN